MGPLHEEMRERRERAGLTLQAIHVATRISTDFLNAIEEGNFKFLPKPYIRLFLRTYANKVGMDPQYVLDRYEDIDRPNEEGEGGRSTTLLPDRPLSWGVTVGMAVGFLLLGFAGASLFKRAAEDVPPRRFLQVQPKSSRTAGSVGPIQRVSGGRGPNSPRSRRPRRFRTVSPGPKGIRSWSSTPSVSS